MQFRSFGHATKSGKQEYVVITGGFLVAEDQQGTQKKNDARKFDIIALRVSTADIIGSTQTRR